MAWRWAGVQRYPRTFGPVLPKPQKALKVHADSAPSRAASSVAGTVRHVVEGVLAAGGVALVAFTGCGTSSSWDDPRVFRYNESAAITSLDPAAARSLEHMWVVDQLYDGLVELCPSLTVEPCLAERWTYTDSTHTYRFHLRPGVTFSTGKPLTASDVVASLERLRDPEVLSSGGWILDAVAPAGIQAVDDSTVDIALTHAYPAFLGLLTTAYGSILDVEAHRRAPDSLRARPLGSGPFELAWWLPDAGLVMHRNPRYWERDDQGRPLPYLEAVHVDVVQDMGAEFLGLTQGRYDFLSGLHPAFMESLLDADGQLQPSWEPTLTLRQIPFLKTDYVGVALHGPQTPEALRDPRVRRALSLALDRHGMVAHLRRNAVRPTDHFVPPSMVGLAVPPEVARNVTLAQALLAEAGHPGGEGIPPLVLSTTSDYADLCAAMQHDWAALGVEVAVDVVPASVHRERVAQGETALFYKSWLADHADAENFLGLFLRANFAPGGPNYTHYEAEGYEALARRALQTADEAERRAIYRQMDFMIHEDMPVIPLFYDQVTHVISNDVEGWTLHPVNRLDLRRVTKRAAGVDKLD